MKKALISIDYTNDFVADEGALTAGKPAQDILNRMMSITKTFFDHHDTIVYAIDLHKEHDKFHPESKLFPPHNLKNSEGRHLYHFYDTQYIAFRNEPQQDLLYLDKTRYSAFCGTNLHQELQARGIREVHLIGVCTDICVLHTAVDAYNLGYSIVVHSDAVASFNQTGHDWALTHFTATLGAIVISNWE